MRKQLKLIEFSLRHGGGTRPTGIVNALIAHNANVLVPAEYRESSRKAIIGPLRTAGWPQAIASAATKSANGLCVQEQQPAFRSRLIGQLRRHRPCSWHGPWVDYPDYRKGPRPAERRPGSP